LFNHGRICGLELAHPVSEAFPSPQNTLYCSGLDESSAAWTPERILSVMGDESNVPTKQLDPPHTYIRLLGKDNPVGSENVTALRNRMREILRLIEHEFAFCGHRLLCVECELLEVPSSAKLVEKPFHHAPKNLFSINRDAYIHVWVPFYPSGTLENLLKVGADEALIANQCPTNLICNRGGANGCSTVSSKIKQKLIIALVRLVALVTTRNFDQLIVPQRVWKDSLWGNVISGSIAFREKATAIVASIARRFHIFPNSTYSYDRRK
jgi:hypothetical protein